MNVAVANGVRSRTDPIVSLVLETGGGGAARNVLDLYRGLTRRGWGVRLILSFVRADPLFLKEVSQLPVKDIVELDMRRGPHATDMLAGVRLRGLMSGDTRRSIVHAHSTKAGLLVGCALPRRQARLFTPHAFRGMDEGLTGVRATGVRLLERFIGQGFDRVIAVSPAELTYATQIGLSPDRLTYIPNGVDIEAMRQAADAARRHRSRRRPRIGFVGRLVYQKNPRTFLETFKILRDRGLDVEAVVIGDGPMRAPLEAYCREAELEDRVRFLGAVVAVGQLPELDVLVHTSQYESLPYTLLEAIAADVPVVSVDNAGSRAIISDRSRLVADCRDAGALAAQVQKILSDSQFRSRVQREDFAGLRRFDYLQMCRQVETEYEAVLRVKTS